MERCVVAYSTKISMEDAFDEVCQILDANGGTPILIIYFSSEESFWYYTQEIKNRYKSSTCIGSCSCRNISSMGYGKTGMSAMAIYSGIECAAGALFEINIHPSNYINHVKTAVKSIYNSAATSSYNNDSYSIEDSTICLEFTTCNCDGEGLVLDTLQAGFGDKKIPVAGSSTGYIDNADASFVALNGELYRNTCVFVIIRNLEGRILTYVENIYKPTKYRFHITDVDCDEHKVYEYDERPAAEMLSGALGVKPSELPDILKTHPMGILTGDDDNSIINLEVKKVFEDGSISYYSRIYNHTRISLMELDDVDSVWLDTELKVNSVIPNPAFGIAINCCARTAIFEQSGLLEKFESVLAQTCRKYIGVSGFGEQINLNTLNVSLVLVVFE